MRPQLEWIQNINLHAHSLTDTLTVLACRGCREVAIRDSCVTDRIIKTTSTMLLICALDTSFSIPSLCFVCARAFHLLKAAEMVSPPKYFGYSHVSAYILHNNNTLLHPNPHSACSTRRCCTSQLKKGINVGNCSICIILLLLQDTLDAHTNTHSHSEHTIATWCLSLQPPWAQLPIIIKGWISAVSTLFIFRFYKQHQPLFLS